MVTYKSDARIRLETEDAIEEFKRYWGGRTTLTDQEREVLDAINTEIGYNNENDEE